VRPSGTRRAEVRPRRQGDPHEHEHERPRLPRQWRWGSHHEADHDEDEIRRGRGYSAAEYPSPLHSLRLPHIRRARVYTDDVTTWPSEWAGPRADRHDHGDSRDEAERTESSRRGFFLSHTAAALLGAAAVGFGSPMAAQAVVQFDRGRYGDKELKIATVNKLKQTVGLAITEKPHLAGQLVRLAISNALSYVAATGEGGLDGSIREEVDQPENADVREAVELLERIRKDIKRTNEVTFADLLSYAGAEAIELVGGPRFSPQLGRGQTMGPSKTSAHFDWGKIDAAEAVRAFERSGMSPKEAAVMISTVAWVDRITAKEEAQRAERKSDNDDDDDDDIFQSEIPDTRVGMQKYGETLGGKSTKLTAQYLKNLLRGGNTTEQASRLELVLLQSPLRDYVEAYAKDNKSFTKDIAEVYQKLSLAGASYSSTLFT